MHRLIRGIALLLLLLGVAVLPTSAQDKGATPDKKDDTKKDEPKKDEPKKDHYFKLTTVTGKIVHLDEAKKMIKVSVEIGPNQGAVNEYQQAQLAVARARNANDLANAQNRLLKAQAGLRTNMEKRDIEYPATEDVKVRLANPPAAFDDKGNPKKYTAKELEELKGADKKTPGYPAEFGDLHTGMMVQITLVTKKDSTKAPLKPKPEDMDDYKPLASLIIAAEVPK